MGKQVSVKRCSKLDQHPNFPSLKVKVADGVPAVITPLKPKYYLKGITTVPAKTAVKL